MKALTLWQPWASLVAWGVKRWETRSWRTSYKGLLAIHSSARMPNVGRELAKEPWFGQSLAKVGWDARLPLGAVVAVVYLGRCVTTTEPKERFDDIEYAAGDFSPGRFAWSLENIRRLDEPVPAKGAMGLWTLPPEVLARILRSLEGRR